MGGMTQTLTGAAMTENYEEPKKSLESQLNSDMDSRLDEPAASHSLCLSSFHRLIVAEFRALCMIVLDIQCANGAQVLVECA
ncbi:MAG: hypothetical protein D4R44_03160 [Actinobacteria bacterium]|nr:MAG: hypothetical protein D4R44_03160 [Actinomycetota bacterium]